MSHVKKKNMAAAGYIGAYWLPLDVFFALFVADVAWHFLQGLPSVGFPPPPFFFWVYTFCENRMAFLARIVLRESLLSLSFFFWFFFFCKDYLPWVVCTPLSFFSSHFCDNRMALFCEDYHLRVFFFGFFFGFLGFCRTHCKMYLARNNLHVFVFFLALFLVEAAKWIAKSTSW